MLKKKEVKDDKLFVNYAKYWFDNRSHRRYNCSKTGYTEVTIVPTENTKLHFDNQYGQSPLRFGLTELYQVGDCYAKSGFQMSEHVQWCDEISYIVSGQAIFCVDGVEYLVRAGDLIFCPKDSVHKIVSNQGNPVRYFYLGYRLIQSAPSFDRWKEIARKLSKLDVPVCHNAFNMIHLFRDLLCEFQQEFEKREMLIELAMLQIILYTYKYFTCDMENTAVYEKRVPDKQELVYEIINYMDNNIMRIKSLKDISRYIGFSYSYTSQIFSSVMHMSLNDYYQEKRFAEAEKLLQGGIGVTQTSEILGFDSVQSFSRAFKTRYGISPQNYVKKSRSK